MEIASAVDRYPALSDRAAAGGAPTLVEKADQALAQLLAELKARGYAFVTTGNATHQRLMARHPARRATTLRDIFGWSLPFGPDELDSTIVDQLRRSGSVLDEGDGLRSAIRVSSLGPDLIIHSRWPTTAPDSVFLGPDTYRFAAFIEQEIGVVAPDSTVVDLGCGAGAGGIVTARRCDSVRLILTDVNPKAVRYSRINCVAAGIEALVVEADGLDAVTGPIDLLVANPPFIAGNEGLTYRDGGDLHGAALSLHWVRAALPRLASKGRILLYTGATIVDGEDEFLGALRQTLDPAAFELRYREIDPDIFGSQLDRPAYRDAERIAAVGVVISRRGS